MLSIQEIKEANDTYFGMESRLNITKEPGKSECATLSYFSPTGKELVALRLARNSSNKGKWYYMCGDATKNYVNLEEMAEKKMKLGEILADMILYGDIEEAPFLPEWAGMPKNDPELYFRRSIAATLLKLTNGSQGGSCSKDDKLVAPYLQQEIGE